MPPAHLPATVGVVTNPLAGKDVRRFLASVSHTSDSAKVGIVRRVVIAAVEGGATRVVLADDTNRLAVRAIDGLHLDAELELIDEPLSGSRHDTVAAAKRMWKEQCGAVVVLGGDGTCRDVAIGWPDVPLIGISTGTNNVYPSPIDGTSAGAAAGLVSSGRVAFDAVARRSKRITMHLEHSSVTRHADDLALVDVAVISASFAGARAVVDPRSVRMVVAAIATPASTGLSSIAGRVHPVGRWEPGGVLVRLGPSSGGRRVRVPLAPGSFATMDVAEVIPLADGQTVQLDGPGMLAFDGERDRPIHADAIVTATVESTGPLVIDVEHALVLAARDRHFDTRLEESHGH